MITLLDFYAVWCGPCHAMDPVMDKILPKYKDKVNLKKIDVDQNREESSKYGVLSIPTYVIEKDGKEVSRKTGWMSELDFENWIKNNLD